jgi:hydroxymethylpyrimidine pyrophosphatase-like HAD family hydrolase
VDGTLLDRQGILRPSTSAAVARAVKAGIRPVLCTGRRYRRALPVARQLGLEAPLVCNSGAIVKDPCHHRTLWRADFDDPLLLEALAVFRERNEPVVSFTDRADHEPDFLVEAAPTGRPLFDDYLSLNHGHAGIEPGWTSRPDLLGHPHFHLCAIGERAAMLEFEQYVLCRLGNRVQTFVQKSPKYAGTMCELIRRDAGKWAAILHLAALWGVSASEVVAVGDDMNDLPMIEGAGLGVAMGHAPERVREAADHVTGDHDHDGVAMLIDRILLAL